jgi:hypothetical protein
MNKIFLCVIPLLTLGSSISFADFEIQRGALGGYEARYQFRLITNYTGNHVMRVDAGGIIRLTAGYYDDTFSLYYYNNNSPENRDSRNMGHFPSQGRFNFSEDDVITLVSHLEKFLEWNTIADLEGLKGVKKDLGEFRDYKFIFTRSQQMQGWCTIQLKEWESVDQMLRNHITLFPPAVEATLELLEL